MAGKKGLAGRKRLSAEELKLRGTYQRSRHDPALRAAEVDPEKLRQAYQRFLTRLKKATAKPGWNPLDEYARALVLREVPAGKYHRAAGVRHMRDREQEGTAEFPFRLDLNKVARFLVFAKECRHYKGRSWVGQPIRLQPHQLFRLGSVVGWVHVETGLRRFRRSYHEIPRKNGKSLEAAMMALYLTFYDDEGGAEGYCTATKKDQAKVVWGDAAQLVRSSILRVGLEVFARSIFDPVTTSKLEPLGSDSDSTDGLNPSVIIHDELHAYKNRKMLDVLETATGSRDQPHDMRITTAGDDPVSPGGDEHEYACQVLDGLITDEALFAFIAHADPEDLDGGGWLSEATARKANPNYGISVKPDDLKALALKARNMPAAAAAFQQKRLNVWVNTSAPWLSLEGWRKGQSQWDDDELLHESCYVGIDLASKIDLCALILLFPPAVGRPSWRIIRHVWTPEDTLLDRAHRDRAPYDVWKQQGHLKTQPGSRLDHSVLRDTLVQARERYDIEQIGFDPWHADKLIADLVKLDGFSEQQVIEVAQTYAGMSNAALLFEAEVLEGRVDAKGCPLMAWCASNAVVQRDGKDNIYPVKKKSRGRIDPIMAAIIARSLAARSAKAEPKAFQMLVIGGGR